MIDDRADESRRLLLMEKSDWVLGEGDEESGILFIEEASDWPEFRIIDRRNGLRDRGLGDSGCWSSAAECGGERMRGCGRRNAVEVRREPCRFRSRKPMGTVELGGPRSVWMERADDGLLGKSGDPLRRSPSRGDFGESGSAGTEGGRGE